MWIWDGILKCVIKIYKLVFVYREIIMSVVGRIISGYGWVRIKMWLFTKFMVVLYIRVGVRNIVIGGNIVYICFFFFNVKLI